MKAKSRRQAREAALQALYSLEIGRARLSEVLRQTLEAADLDEGQALFARDLIEGVFKHQTELDERLMPLVAEWDYERIAAVDRNVLRLAAFEFYHCPTIPPLATINEAIELAKKFSTAESGRFVNGVLGRLIAENPKAVVEPYAPTGPADEPVAQPEADTSATEDAGLWRLRREPPAEAENPRERGSGSLPGAAGS